MYQALYRKYRPQTFSDVVGQKSVTDTLRAQLETGRLSHAYLFTGTRGTGKTSCAKILAKAVNCENPNHGDPCGVCPSCRAIDEGSCMDVLEIDAASNNGVDSVRVLRDDAIYTPGTVKMRVYIIDEVHMLSTAAFNALLKIIEEPPAHLLFILATTELQKVPATILSRCQRFAFKRLRAEEIASRLNFIAYQEHIEIEPDAVNLLARLADGGMRDGVSLLDQCASAAGGAVTLESVYASLGLAGERRTAELMQAIAQQDTAKALTVFSSLYAAGKDVGALLGEMCALCRDLLVLHTAPKPETPAGFWPALSEKLRAELSAKDRGFFAANGPLHPVLQGESTLIMAADNEFVLGMVKKPAIEQLIREKASALLGRPVAVRFALKNQVSNLGKDPMDALVQFGEQHSDIFTIK